MKEILSLSIVCLVAALVLALVHHLTEPYRTSNRQAFETRQLEDLIPTHARLDACEAGYELYRIEESGYGGPIKLGIVYTNGKLSGVRAFSHQETPGFADILQPTAWIGSFGTLPSPQIDAVTRAPITSSAVIRAVQQAEVQKVNGVSPCN